MFGLGKVPCPVCNLRVPAREALRGTRRSEYFRIVMPWAMPIAAQFSWPADGLAALVVKVSLWAFVAFWLWIPLALLLRKLKLPQPLVVAAMLSWIGAGLSLPWALSHAQIG